MRYLPHTPADRAAMMASIGINSIDDLFVDVPSEALLFKTLDLPLHNSEIAVERHLAGLADKNVSTNSVPCFLGAGAYRHHIPAAVDHLIQRSEFLTSYTPYQPEISQGTLQYLFEFQTQVALLTGMEVANASMYDGATACAEAVLMANRVTKRKKVILSGGLHPHYAETTKTVSQFIDLEINVCSADLLAKDEFLPLIDDKTACVVIQTPDLFGRIHDLSTLAEVVHAKGALLVAVVTEIISLGAIVPPGQMGADIVVGEGQSLGNALNFGGPYLGLFATRQKFVRQMPGRVCGETVDEDGRRGYVLTLSTREQHIRREKATSNICTNSGLCSLAFSIHLSLLGEEGFKRLAQINHSRAVDLSEKLASLEGVELINESFFNEFTLRLNKPAEGVVDQLVDLGILAGVPVGRLHPNNSEMENLLLIAVTEMNREDDEALLINALRKVL